MKESDRSFAIQSSSVGYTGGRYISHTAQGAAYHAANILSQVQGKRNNKAKSEITFVIKETTRGSSKKEYPYRAVITKRDKPLTWTVRSGRELKTLKSTHQIQVFSRST